MRQILLSLMTLSCIATNAQGWEWTVQRANEVKESGETIAQTGYQSVGWLKAPVPGTVARAWQEAKLLEDICYDDNLTRIDDRFFDADFWYRTEFEAPALKQGERLILNFDGINWKADVWLNGHSVGQIQGAFIRSHFDITQLVKTTGRNALAVRIYHNEHYGDVKIPTLERNVPNGGVLGEDNPTFHASIGWDWLPTVPGRNIGIWNDVTLTVAHGGVVIGDAFFDTRLPGVEPRHPEAVKSADVSPVITLHNYNKEPMNAELVIRFGDNRITRSIKVEPGQQDVALEKFTVEQPRLWWPVGYGEPYLYDVSIEAKVNGKSLAEKHMKCGIRQMDYTLENSAIQLYINGRRFIAHGGNWGFSEINLDYTARDYDIALRYHRDMHLNMVRNWVGQVGDEEFYEACDRHGIMIWQDFWLANPYDGPNPKDEKMFLENANDMVHKVRPYASVALYCGRNEGNPPDRLGLALNMLVSDLCPNSLYISHSADYNVSGGGPYRALSPKEFYGIEKGQKKFHSERGMPTVPSYESMCRMLRPEHRWPQNDVWAMHNFTLNGAQKCSTYNERIKNGLGEPQSLKEYADRAQWVNYEGYRAIFESRSNYRNGILLWMSHPAWPCLVFQTYDYYFDVNGAYFGSKKACQPLHISWNPLKNVIEVVNESAGNRQGLTASVQVVNMDGSTVMETTRQLDILEDQTVEVCPLTLNKEKLSEVYFVKLTLKDGTTLLADNFYWEGREEGNWKALQNMAKPKLQTKVERQADGSLKVTVKNPSKMPALMIRLNLINSKTKEQVLPAFYEDNYFSLLGGEEKTVSISWLTNEHPDNKNFKPTVTIEQIR